MTTVGATPDLTAALAEVPQRLRSLRIHRRLTLENVATATGISRSTLSRLENGQRRPTLELLLALASTYRVPLDTLVGAPETGDLRIRLRPRRVRGRTVVPLTRTPDGMQAWKIVIPSTMTQPEVRAHEGHEWLYVLAGRLRLVLGDADVVLETGEIAEFDTVCPHWFGSPGDTDVEILSLYGRHGDRRHLRPVVSAPSGARGTRYSASTWS